MDIYLSIIFGVLIAQVIIGAVLLIIDKRSNKPISRTYYCPKQHITKPVTRGYGKETKIT